MRLTAKQGYALLDKHGSFITEICDACGKGIGPIRFTRRGDSEVWCSRECRDGADAREPGTCRLCRSRLPEAKKRGALFCDDACRKAAQRENGKQQTPRTPELSRTKPSIYAGFSSGKRPAGISGCPIAISPVLEQM
jgi:hypothetical protein